MDSDGELRLTIMATLVQEESRKNEQQNDCQQGRTQMGFSPPIKNVPVG